MDFSLALRTDSTYPFSNIFLISSIQNNNYLISDTIGYSFENDETKWYEIKPSGIKNNKILLKKDLKLDKGDVIVKLKHSIRYLDSIVPLTKLDGILDVGLIVEKSLLDEKDIKRHNRNHRNDIKSNIVSRWKNISCKSYKECSN